MLSLLLFQTSRRLHGAVEPKVEWSLKGLRPALLQEIQFSMATARAMGRWTSEMVS